MSLRTFVTLSVTSNTIVAYSFDLKEVQFNIPMLVASLQGSISIGLDINCDVVLIIYIYVL